MKSKYKKSHFNYETLSDSGNGYIIYNTVYNTLVRLTKEEYEQYKTLFFTDNILEDELYQQGLLMEETINELKIYNLYTELAMKYREGTLSITVTPSMECNARCFYCYEEGVRAGKMKKEDADKIVECLLKLNPKEKIELTWFGGEPLLNQEWMDYFSLKLKEAGIDFNAFMISNGSKITDSVIQKMKNDWNISSIQITFDGDEEEYCKRKDYVDQDETIYFKMLSIIKKLVKEGISVQIRLNIDLDNIESIYSVTSDIEQIFNKYDNITFYPAFLNGSKRKMTEDEKVDIIKEIFKRLKNIKMLPVNSYLYKYPKTQACYYNVPTAFSVDTNGNIYNCEHFLGHKEKAIGNIYDDWSKIDNRREVSGKRLECQKCVFLPKCQGGCHSTYIQGEVPCFIDKYIIKAYLKLL